MIRAQAHGGIAGAEMVWSSNKPWWHRYAAAQTGTSWITRVIPHEPGSGSVGRRRGRR
jgi:hypothetical protein